jgi:acetyl esterase
LKPTSQERYFLLKFFSLRHTSRTFVSLRKAEGIFVNEFESSRKMRHTDMALALLERGIMQSLMRIPPHLLLRVLRRKTIVMDGRTLNAEMQVILHLQELARAPGLSGLPPAESRANIVRTARIHGLRVPEVSVKDLKIPSRVDHDIPARLYRMKHKENAPLVVFYHGGGFVLGGVEAYDDVCRFICRELACPVLSIEYRLAPEHPYPAGLEDAIDSFRWAQANAQALLVDPTRFVVAGDSAGGNFATILCQLAVEEKSLAPFLQLLIYPTADRSKTYPSEKLFGKGFFLTDRDLAYFQEHYSTGKSLKPEELTRELSNPRISPIHGTLTGLAPAIIVTAGFDPLRDEGAAYAKALQEAGTETKLIECDDMIHGFINMIGFSRAARGEFLKILKVVRTRLQ